MTIVSGGRRSGQCLAPPVLGAVAWRSPVLRWKLPHSTRALTGVADRCSKGSVAALHQLRE